MADMIPPLEGGGEERSAAVGLLKKGGARKDSGRVVRSADRWSEGMAAIGEGPIWLVVGRGCRATQVGSWGRAVVVVNRVHGAARGYPVAVCNYSVPTKGQASLELTGGDRREGAKAAGRASD